MCVCVCVLKHGEGEYGKVGLVCVSGWGLRVVIAVVLCCCVFVVFTCAVCACFGMRVMRTF